MAHESTSIRRRAFLLGGVGSLILPPVARAFAQATAMPDLGPALRPEMFGATGDGGDDSPGLLRMVAAVNRAGRGHIVFTPGKTYLLGHVNQSTLYFQRLSGLLIEGRGATLKTRDNGCPTQVGGPVWGQNWGQMTIDNCTNVRILGLTFDGNRDGQRHTVGAKDGFGYNAGLNFWTADSPHRTGDVEIRGCIFRDHGTLTESNDVRGDGIFAMTGVKRMRIEECRFERVGRWAFALAEGDTPSEHVYFSRNKVFNENRAETNNRPWGAVDIEDTGLPNRHIYIEDNQFDGTCQVALTGYRGAPRFEVIVEDIYIRRNTWQIPPTGGTATNVPWTLGFSLPGTGTYRTLRRLFIEDNVVVWEGIAMATHIGHSAKLRDVFIRRNKLTSRVPEARSEGGLTLGWAGHIEGRIEITDNEFIGLGEAIVNTDSWYADPSPAPLTLVVERNRFDNCFRAFNFHLTKAAVPPGSSAVFRGNRTSRTRSENGEALDGGQVGIDLYNRPLLDKVWMHRNVTPRGS
jgi:polygalacturonase